MRTLPSDYARCEGGDQAICRDCMRRLTIESDNGVRSYIMPPVKNNDCDFYIPVNQQSSK